MVLIMIKCIMKKITMVMNNLETLMTITTHMEMKASMHMATMINIIKNKDMMITTIRSSISKSSNSRIDKYHINQNLTKIIRTLKANSKHMHQQKNSVKTNTSSN